MTMLTLDKIPELVKSGKLSVSGACIAVHKIIYTNYPRFDLESLDEDSRSDLLLEFLEKRVKKLLERYDPEVAPFGAYVFKALQNSKNSFLKRRALRSSFGYTIFRDSMFTYAEQMQKTMHDVTDVADEIPPYKPKDKNEEIPQLVFKRVFKKIPHRLTCQASQERRLRQGLLILALKSAWYINDEQIKKVSAFCQVSEDIISSSVCTLKSKLINKALNKRDIEQRRNRAFCFIDSYKSQLEEEKLYGKTSHFENLIKSLEYQQVNWERKNSLLNRGHFKVAPSNSEIAKVIGLPHAVVSRYLTNFNKADISKIKEALG